jgi:hypothetical protein
MANRGRLRQRLISHLRASSIEDASYSTERYGRVPSFRGAAIEGVELLIGHPPSGHGGALWRASHVSRTPLQDVETSQLCSLVAAQLWHAGAISYTERLALNCGQLHENVRRHMEAGKSGKTATRETRSTGLPAKGCPCGPRIGAG